MFGLFLWYFLIILRGSHIEDSTNAEKSFLHVLQFSGIVIANAACSANCSKSEVVEVALICILIVSHHSLLKMIFPVLCGVDIIFGETVFRSVSIPRILMS